MTKESANTKSQTLSVGETAKRLDVSPDSVRNYCERGWLQFVRARSNHRRVLLRSIEVFEAQRRPDKPDPFCLPEPPPPKCQVDEDFELATIGDFLTLELTLVALRLLQSRGTNWKKGIVAIFRQPRTCSAKNASPKSFATFREVCRRVHACQRGIGCQQQVRSAVEDRQEYRETAAW
jgi:hypothetical protein